MADGITIGTSSKLGGILRDARRTKGLSQEELALRAGVSRSWLARVEAGHLRMELGTLLRLLDALDLDLTLTPRAAPVPGDTARRADAASRRRAAWGLAASLEKSPEKE